MDNLLSYFSIENIKIALLFFVAIAVSASLLYTIKKISISSSSFLFKTNSARNFVLLFLVIITVLSQSFPEHFSRDKSFALYFLFLILPSILLIHTSNLASHYAHIFFAKYFEENKSFAKSFKRLFLSIDLMIFLFSFIYIVRKQQLIDIALFKDDKIFKVFYFLVKVFALNRIAFFTNDLIKTLSSVLHHKNRTFSKIASSLSVFIYTTFWALFSYLIVSSFNFNVQAEKILSISWKIVWLLGIAYSIHHTASLLTKYYVYVIKNNDTESDNHLISSINLLGMVIRLIVIALTILVAIYVVTGKPPSGVLAAMGVGGVALALAAQDLIKNILSGITLMVDRPFSIGQNVNVFEHEGSIENIGFRSTQLRTFDGHLVSIPNAQISDSVIKNASERQYIRYKGFINLTFDHTAEQIEEAVAILSKILDDYQDELYAPSLVNFIEIGTYSLNILMIFYHTGSTFDKYYAFCEKVNLRILREFTSAGLVMAFPRSEVLLLKNDDK